MAEVDVNHDVPKIGQLLVERDLITTDQLNLALDTQRRCGRRLGDILLDENMVSMAALNSALLEQFRIKLAVVMLAFGASLLPAVTANAAGASTIMLIGTVAPADVVSVNNNASRIDIDLDATTGTAPVTKITERTHSQTGFSMLLQAKSVTESGQPAFTSENAGSVPYTLYYDNHEIHFMDGKATLSDMPASTTGNHAASRELLVRSSHIDDLFFNNYSDTLTLIIVTK